MFSRIVLAALIVALAQGRMQVKRQVDIPSVQLPTIPRQHHRHIKLDSGRRQNLVAPILNIPKKDSLLPVGVDPAIPLIGPPKVATSSVAINATSSSATPSSTAVVMVSPSAVVVTQAGNQLSTSTTWIVATAQPQVASVTGGSEVAANVASWTLFAAMSCAVVANLANSL